MSTEIPFQIKNKLSEQCLKHESDDISVSLGTCSLTLPNRWLLYDVGGDLYFHLNNTNTGRCLTTTETCKNAIPEGCIDMELCTTSNDQEFYAFSESNGTFNLQNPHTNTCIYSNPDGRFGPYLCNVEWWDQRWSAIPIRPTDAPTFDPTQTPTQAPTQTPTQEPTRTQSQAPTQNPTQNPSNPPTKNQTQFTSQGPTIFPTLNPTQHPALYPISNTLNYPTVNITNVPSDISSKSPVNDGEINDDTTMPTESEDESDEYEGNGQEPQYPDYIRRTILMIVVLLCVLCVLLCVAVCIIRNMKDVMVQEGINPDPNIVVVDQSSGILMQTIPSQMVLSTTTDDVDYHVMRMVCTDCRLLKTGKIFETDELFYCMDCWEHYFSKN